MDKNYVRTAILLAQSKEYKICGVEKCGNRQCGTMTDLINWGYVQDWKVTFQGEIYLMGEEDARS